MMTMMMMMRVISSHI